MSGAYFVYDRALCQKHLMIAQAFDRLQVRKFLEGLSENVKRPAAYFLYSSKKIH